MLPRPAWIDRFRPGKPRTAVNGFAGRHLASRSPRPADECSRQYDLAWFVARELRDCGHGGIGPADLLDALAICGLELAVGTAAKEAYLDAAR